MQLPTARIFAGFRFCVTIFFVVVAAIQALGRPLPVTIEELQRAPKEFNGKEISVEGYYDQTQEHSPFIARSQSEARRRTAHAGDVLIFVDVKRSQITHRSIKLIDRGYVRVVGLFQHKSTKGRPLKRDPKNPERVIWQSSVGFGWGGIYSMQITNVKELLPMPRPKS